MVKKKPIVVKTVTPAAPTVGEVYDAAAVIRTSAEPKSERIVCMRSTRNTFRVPPCLAFAGFVGICRVTDPKYHRRTRKRRVPACVQQLRRTDEFLEASNKGRPYRNSNG
eukprot:4625788-Pyramimonas_sp.AAC.2